MNVALLAMSGGEAVLWAAGALTALIIFAFFLASLYRKVGPNEVLIVSGLGCAVRAPDGRVLKHGYKIVQGGGMFVIPMFQRVQMMSLEIMTIDVKTPEVQSITGMPVIVEGVAQIKVAGNDQAIMTASEMFLDKSTAEIMQVAHQTLEGHLRAIIGQMDPVALFREREKFAQAVQTISQADFKNMGLEVVSFTMKEVKDNMAFYETMAQAPKAEMDRDTAIKKAEAERDAQIRQAAAERDATIQSSEARKLAQEARFRNEAEVKKAERDYNINAANYRAEAERANAIAARAAEIEDQKQLQTKRAEETKLAQLEAVRKERELDSMVREPAKAERDRINLAAEAERFKLETEAQGRASATRNLGSGEADAIKARGVAEADVRRAQGLAEAEVILAKGQSEAEAMSKKADAWRSYNEAAVTQMFIEKLPAVAEAVAKPLSQVEKIVMISNGSDGIGASKITREVIDIVSQLPPILEGVSGLNIKDLVQNLPKIGRGEKKSS
jgi:flotillin